MMFKLEDIEAKEVAPGYRAKFVHCNNMTFAYWQITADHSLPQHSHPHEQVVNMMEGEFELIVDGKPHRLKPNMVFVIPPHVEHGGRSITDCRMLDVFHPVREDYQKLSQE